MKSIFLKIGVLVLFCTVATVAQAQITITSANLMNVGDSSSMRSVPYTGAVGDSGVNQTWSFPQFLGNDPTEAVVRYRVVAPASTPFGNVGGTDVALAQDSAFQYFFRRTTGNNQGLFLKALAFPPSAAIGLPIPGTVDPVINLDNAIPFMATPATMGTRASGSGRAPRIAFPFSDTIQQGALTLFVDSIGVQLQLSTTSRINGWGSLTLGTRTFPALRQVYTLSIVPNLSVHAFTRILGRPVPFGWISLPAGTFPIPDLGTTSIQYWTNTEKAPLVSLTLDTLGNATDALYMAFPTTSTAKPLQKSGITQLAPNPAHDWVQVLAAGQDLASLAPVVRIFNAAGAQVAQHNAAQFSVATLPKGAYMVNITMSNGAVERHRLVVQ